MGPGSALPRAKASRNSSGVSQPLTSTTSSWIRGIIEGPPPKPNSPTFVNDQKSLRVSPSNARAPPWRGLPACRCARSVQAVAVEERFGLGVARHGVEAAPQDGPALGQAHALVLERLGEHQEQLEVAARVGAAHDVHVEVERV